MSGQQLPINLSGIIIAVMLVLAALFNKPPLRSDRPPPAKIAAEVSGPFQSIPARIWEDPFEAVARQPVQVAAPASADIIAEFLAYLAATSPSNPLPRLLILPVQVSGAPHPAIREMRLRMRVAVHAGLASAGFLPLRGDRIGAWTWSWPTGVSLQVPYEAFKQDADGRRIVLLLWLNDEVISRDMASELSSLRGGDAGIGPLAMIDGMLGALGYPERDAGGMRAPWPGYASSAVRVIGPASSDSLEAMYAEQFIDFNATCAERYLRIDNGPAAAGGEGVWQDSPLNFMLISPSATAPATNLIGLEVPDGKFTIPGPARPDRTSGVCATLAIHRTVTTDDRIIRELVDELGLRGIDPTAARGDTSRISGIFGAMQPSPFLAPRAPASPGPRDHVVLISEWDTKFGRTLPILFDREVQTRWCGRQVAAGCPGTNGARNAADPRATCTLAGCLKGFGGSAPWIHRFAYVRGLDGDTPAAPGEGSGRGPKTDIVTFATGSDAGFKEPAIGTNQFDYLRRLALEIAELDASLIGANRGSIKAFGILGNDYYDKLLILQALKERFPSQLYFTTDLDAGYLDAKVFRWTRNLVVAAPLGLTLRRAFDGPAEEDLQGMVPPFRNSYQTAMYLATLRTLAGSASGIAGELAAEHPRLFEVGYGRFFDLSRSGRPADPGAGAGEVESSAAAKETTGEPETKANTASGSDTAPEAVEPLHAAGPASLHPESGNEGLAPFIASHLLSTALTLLLGLGLVIAISPGARWRAGTALIGDAYNAPHTAGSGGSSAARAPCVIIDWIERRAELLVTLAYLAIALIWLLPVIRLGEEPFAWFGGVSIWPSEIIRLAAGWAAMLCLIYGWRRVRDADRLIEQRFELEPDASAAGGGSPRFAAWYLGMDAEVRGSREGEDTPDGSSTLAAKICRLFSARSAEPAIASDRFRDAALEWRHYRGFSSGRARLARVLPAAVFFWLLAFVVVFGFVDPLSPHRGSQAYLFSTLNAWVLVGFPSLALLFAAMDEALLCGGLLRRLGGAYIRWPVNTLAAGCDLDAETRSAVNYWITMEFIAERTAPSAHVIHLPFLVILFLLLSLSTRFDNWSTPAGAFGLVLLAIAIALLASMRLRRTAQRIRARVLEDLTEEVSGIEYASARTHSEQLQRLVARIKAINEGAYSKWYSEPVFRALAWVFGVGVLIITEYARVG